MPLKGPFGKAILYFYEKESNIMTFQRYQLLKKIDFGINLSIPVLAMVCILAIDWVVLIWMLPLVVGSWQVTSFLFWRIYTPKSCYLRVRKEYGVFLLVSLPIVFIWFLTTVGNRFEITILLGAVLLLISAYMALWYIRLTYYEAFKQTAEQ
jgi:hypothetical protein